MIKIGMNGALGRMGSRILTLAHQSKDFAIGGAFEHKKNTALGQDLGALLNFKDLKLKVVEVSGKQLGGCEVMIDFSGPDGSAAALEACLVAQKPIVIGTTGIDKEGVRRIREAAKKIAVLYAPNMSVGANLLFELARIAAASLKAGYDIEIVEAHHRMKKDAPSGTAKKLAEVIAKEKGWDLEKAARYGRKGFTGERTDGEIGIHVIRAGEIVGEHTAIFSGPGETLEIVHRAQSRDAFARGALAAAKFIYKKNKGLYAMTDVLKG